MTAFFLDYDKSINVINNQKICSVYKMSKNAHCKILEHAESSLNVLFCLINSSNLTIIYIISQCADYFLDLATNNLVKNTF